MLPGMAYQVTPAFRTESDARHAGDPVWPGNSALIIRRANVYPTRREPSIARPGGADLGWVEMIGPLLQAGVGIGKTVYDVKMQRDDRKHAREQEKKAEQIAAQELELAKQASAAAAQQASAINVASVKSNPLVLSGIAAAAALGLFFLLRRK